MEVKLSIDVSFVDSQYMKKKCNFDDDNEESTESTFYGQDYKAIEVLFDDGNCSDCSSSNEESTVSSKFGSYTRTFGDEDSLVLAKGLYLQRRKEEKLDEEFDVAFEEEEFEEEEFEEEEFEEESEVLGLSAVYSLTADSTNPTLPNEDSRAFVGAFFDDDSVSICSSSTEDSDITCHNGTYTRTFGDEDSLVLAKRRQQVPEVGPQLPISSRTEDILLRPESIFEGETVSIPKREVGCHSRSALQLLFNRRTRYGGGGGANNNASINLQRKR